MNAKVAPFRQETQRTKRKGPPSLAAFSRHRVRCGRPAALGTAASGCRAPPSVRAAPRSRAPACRPRNQAPTRPARVSPRQRPAVSTMPSFALWASAVATSRALLGAGLRCHAFGAVPFPEELIDGKSNRASARADCQVLGRRLQARLLSGNGQPRLANLETTRLNDWTL
jgi:hypothetical protein